MGIFAFQSVFTIRKIETEPSNVLLTIDAKQISANLLFFPEQKVKTILLQEYPALQDVQFTKKYPWTLVVKVSMRVPIAYVMTNNAGVQVDSQGIPFSIETDTNLPIVDVGIQDVSLGKKIESPALSTTISFLSMYAQHDKIKSVVLSNNSTLTFAGNEFATLINVEDNGYVQADTLHTLVKGFRMKGSVPRVIDLRFNKPIITP